MFQYSERKACCDSKVQSTAGRSFCYSQITFPPGTFNSCKNRDNDHAQVYACCDDGGDDGVGDDDEEDGQDDIELLE